MSDTKQAFTWAPLVPLIGGFPVGVEHAFGTPPEAIYSYPGIGNDEHYVNYQQNTLGRKDVDFVTFAPDDTSFVKKINLIVCTPPCAGLSSLNTSKNPLKQGHTGEQNQAMYDCLTSAITKFNADVIAIENAPALATKKGRIVADKLRMIAKEYGYSTVLYKTSTHFHGLPQRRDRTFAIFFNNSTVPKLEYEKMDFVPFKDYLQEMKLNRVEDDTIINPKLLSADPYYLFLKDKFGDVRKTLNDAGHVTCLNFVRKKGYADEITTWVEKNGTDKHKHIINHANNKFAQGLGVWDSSVHIFDEYMNAVIGRNMVDTLHPTEDRSLTYLEAMHLMGLPEDFELLEGKKNMNHIAQNVSCHSAEFVGRQALLYLKGELEQTDFEYVKQDNWNDKIEQRCEKKAAPVLDTAY